MTERLEDLNHGAPAGVLTRGGRAGEEFDSGRPKTRCQVEGLTIKTVGFAALDPGSKASYLPRIEDAECDIAFLCQVFVAVF